MKALMVPPGFGIEQLAFTERATPVPAASQVRVRVRAASLNYRDLLIAQGSYNPRMLLPRILGSDAAGEVIEVGPGVTTIQLGDRVAGCFFQEWPVGPITDRAAKSALGSDRDGVLAEEVLLEEHGIVPIPTHLNFSEAATLPCAALTAWNALQNASCGPGSAVLLIGTGGVSIFALQFAKALGARTLLVSRSQAKATRAKTLGADEVFDSSASPDWDKWARALTANRGVDVVVEVGGAGTLDRSSRAVTHGGHIALIGVLAGGTSFNPMPLLMKAVTLRGVFVGSREQFLEMNAMLEKCQLRPVIDRHFPFLESIAALRYLESSTHFGKVVIEFP